MSGPWCQTLVIGSAMYSANAPVRDHADALGVRAQVAPAGHAVAAAAAHEVALAADEVAGREAGDVRRRPRRRRRRTRARSRARPGSSSAAQASQLEMCRSVPQIPVRSTRISTSLIPISGSGTSWSHSPGSAWAFTSARIRAATRLVGRVQCEWTISRSPPPRRSPRSCAAARRARARSSRPRCGGSRRSIRRSTRSSSVDGERALAAADAVEPGDAQPFAGVPIAIKGNVPRRGLRAQLRLEVPRRLPARPLRLPRPAAARGGLRDRRHRRTCRSSRSCRRPSRATAGPTRNPWDLDAHAGRVERRLGGGGRGRDAPARARQRRRRLDPHPRGLLRPGRAQAEPRAGLGRARTWASRGWPATACSRARWPTPRTRSTCSAATRSATRTGRRARRALRDRDAARPRQAAGRRHRRPTRSASRRRRRGDRRRCASAPSSCAALGHEVVEAAPAVAARRRCWRSSSTSSGRRSRSGSTPPCVRIRAASRRRTRSSRCRARCYERARADARRSPTWARWRSCRRSRAGSSAFFADYDLLVTPALAERPLPIGECHGLGEDPLRDLDRSGLFTPYTSLFNVTGQPAISLPVGLRRRRPADRRPARRQAARRGPAAAGRSAARSRAPVGAPAPRHRRHPRAGVTPSASASAVPRALSISTASSCASSQVISEVGPASVSSARSAARRPGQRERQRAPAPAARRRARAARPRAA